jgi:hypothetical protein
MKEGTGKEIKWHENGAVDSETDFVDGTLNGLMRGWSHDGVLIFQHFYYDGRPVSKKKYDVLCEQHCRLPKYGSVRVSKTLGRWFSELQKKQVADLDVHERRRREFDEQCESDLVEADTIEFESLLKTRRICSLGDLESKEVRGWIKSLKSSGACRIWATRVEKDPDGSRHSNRLIIELPDNRKRRKAIFEMLLFQAKPFLNGRLAVVEGDRFVAVSVV